MKTVKTSNFDIGQIAASGQCFRMTKLDDDKYEVIALDKYLTVSQIDDKVTFDCSEEEYESFWKHYFDLETDYGKYIEAVDPDDVFLNNAVKKGEGIRILNQDLWEMIVSFLISQQNNITRIRKCIKNISEKYGRKCVNKDGDTYYAFPTAESLACLEEDALMECNLGYRSKYVVRTAKAVLDGSFILDSVSGCDYETARERLMELYGVGKKVADCICLFSLHHIEAFPIDTHIKQVLDREYNGVFPFERYDGFAGVIQQYIFFNEI